MFSALMLYSIINMILKIKSEGNLPKTLPPTNKIANALKLNGTYFDKSLKKQIDYGMVRVPAGCSIMFGAGILSGLLGIGSGIFKVIAMDTVMKMPLKPSSATSNLMMGVTACASAIVYFFNATIIPQIAVPVIIGVLGGAAIGSKIMPKIPPLLIRILFVIIMAVFCAQMIMKAVNFI